MRDTAFSPGRGELKTFSLVTRHPQGSLSYTRAALSLGLSLEGYKKVAYPSGSEGGAKKRVKRRDRDRRGTLQSILFKVSEVQLCP